MFQEQREEQIGDQVIDKYQSSKLRRKLLEKGQALTLNQALSIARSSEAADLQAQKMESSGGLSVESGNEVPVNRVSSPASSISSGRCSVASAFPMSQAVFTISETTRGALFTINSPKSVFPSLFTS